VVWVGVGEREKRRTPTNTFTTTFTTITHRTSSRTCPFTFTRRLMT
jgi:hypothetical protein